MYLLINLERLLKNPEQTLVSVAVLVGIVWIIKEIWAGSRGIKLVLETIGMIVSIGMISKIVSDPKRITVYGGFMLNLFEKLIGGIS